MSEPFAFRHLNRLVGVFVIGSATVLLAGVVLIGKARHWLAKEFTVTVAFDRNNLGLLRPGLPVKIQGTDAGEVSGAIQERLNTVAHLSLREEFRSQLRSDAKAIIHTPIAGFLGETFIEIWPGQAETPFNAESGLITQLPGDDMLEQARLTITNFGQASAELRDLIAENRKELTATMTAVRTTAEAVALLVAENRVAVSNALTRMEEMTHQVADAVAENRPNVKAVTDALPHTLATVDRTVDSVGGAARSADTAAVALTATATQVTTAVKTADTVVNENRADLAQAMADLHDLLQSATAATEHLEQISGQVAAGKGSLGKAVMSDEAHDKLVKVADNANQTMEQLQPLITTITSVKLYLGVAGGGDLNSGVTDASAYLRLEPSSEKFYTGGVTYQGPPRSLDPDVETSDGFPLDFDLQLGWRFMPHEGGHWLNLSAGVLNSRLGGVIGSQLWSDRIGAELLVRGKQNNREVTDRRYEDGSVLVRATLSVRMLWRVYGEVGGNDLSGTPGWWLGGRIELLDNDLRNLTTFGPLFR